MKLRAKRRNFLPFLSYQSCHCLINSPPDQSAALTSVAGVESPSDRTKSSNRRRSRRSRFDQFFVWQKRHKFASVRPKELRVWRPGNRAIFSGGPKWSSTSSPSSIFLESHDLKTAHTDVFDAFLCFHAASQSASARGRPHVHIHFDTLPWLLLSKRQRRKDVQEKHLFGQLWTP